MLCPQIVATNVTAGGPGDDREATRTSESNSAVHQGFQTYGSKASKMADLVFEAASTGQFYLLADMDTDVGFVRAAAEKRYQAILEDGRGMDGALAGGGGLPAGAASSDAMASIFAPPPQATVEELVEAVLEEQ